MIPKSVQCVFVNDVICEGDLERLVILLRFEQRFVLLVVRRQFRVEFEALLFPGIRFEV